MGLYLGLLRDLLQSIVVRLRWKSPGRGRSRSEMSTEPSGRPVWPRFLWGAGTSRRSEEGVEAGAYPEETRNLLEIRVLRIHQKCHN